ncbi:MAG: ATP-binding protein [Eubacteriales bacterium]
MIDKEYFGESKDIEFKLEIPKKREKFLKDVIAFSNCTGGKIIIGIEDKTHMVYGIGEQNPFKLSDSISNMISDACTPQIDPYITMETLDGKTVIVIDVLAGKFRPYYIESLGKESSTYIRINGTSRSAESRKLQELELEGQKISYDTLQAIGNKFNEEKALELCNKMKEIAVASRVSDEEKTSVKNITLDKLEDLGLLCKVGKDWYPTHAFILMTDNKIKFAKIQCALFKGITRDVFIDRKEFDGAIYTQIEDAYQFVLKHINLGTEIEGLYRKDYYELPILSVREMIANAIVHRSYLDDSSIQVSVYEDRVEVMSPGMLYGGMDLETAMKGKSKCRNAALAEAFYYMGIVEAWGTGIPRIINKCKEYGLPSPTFEELGDGFKVTMFRKVSNASEKVSNASEKVSNASFVNKDLIQEGIDLFDKYIVLLKQNNVSLKCISNIEVIFRKFNKDTIFGQSDVMQLLECSKSKATKLMGVMKDADLIEVVRGLGAGKYKFKNY